MRTWKSVVAVVSTALLVACQTAVSPGINRAPTPVSSAQSSLTAPSARSAAAFSENETTAPLAVEAGRRKTWIIVALVAAIAIVAVILVSGGSDSGGIY